MFIDLLTHFLDITFLRLDHRRSKNGLDSYIAFAQEEEKVNSLLKSIDAFLVKTIPSHSSLAFMHIEVFSKKKKKHTLYMDIDTTTE